MHAPLRTSHGRGNLKCCFYNMFHVPDSPYCGDPDAQRVSEGECSCCPV
jgi:hypothetical protein